MTAITGLNGALSDRYTIERELGAGGMATVYLAHDIKHERDVAIKVLREDLFASLGAGRFLREIKIAAQLQHPHILPLLDSGEAASQLYFVMPYIKGQSLRERLARDGELPVHEAVRLATEVVDALVEAHAHGVVHRDIKPDNVMLSGRHALVTDFGVAKALAASQRPEASPKDPSTVTTLGVAVGTPTYMSPEQAAADPHVDHRSDIYSVGVMLYEMLTGRPPFTGTTPQQVLAAHVAEAPGAVSKRRASISPALEGVVMQCLAKRPADRFQTAVELHAALEALATPATGITPTPMQPITAIGITAHRRVWPFAASVGAIAVIGVMVFVITRRAARPITLLTPVQVTRSAGIPEMPVITPDGHGVAYAVRAPGDTVAQVEFRRVDGGGSVVLAERGEPRAWSPDGSRLLVATDRGLESIPALGGPGTLLMAGSAYGTWSPDGRGLAYVMGDSVFVRAGNGAAVRVGQKTDPYSLAWSPDSRWIAFASGNSRYMHTWNIATSSIWIVPAIGGDAIRITGDDSMHMSPVWSPDSKRLLFVAGLSGSRDIDAINIDSHGHPVGNAVPITKGINASVISITPDGRTLAYSVAINRDAIWSVTVPATGTASSRDAQPVTTDREYIENFDISTDGKWLVFDSDRAGLQQIFRRLLAGGEVQQITHDTVPALGPSVSTDDDNIAYHTIANGIRQVFVTPADGSLQPVQVSRNTTPYEVYGRFSPDGKRLAWVTDLTPSRFVTSVADRTGNAWSAPKEVTWPGTWVAPAWFGDSALLAFQGGLRLGTPISAISLEGASERQLLTGGSAIPISQRPYVNVAVPPEMNVIYEAYRADNTAGPTGVDEFTFGTDKVRKVLRFDDSLHPHRLDAFNLVAHGGRFYFTLDNPQSDIWVVPVTGLGR